MLPKGGELAENGPKATARFRAQYTDRASPAGQPDMEGWERFARSAEDEGIESVLISCGPHEPDTLLVACALGRATERLKFIVAYRSGWIQPTTFIQQMNTLSALIGGRIALNIVADSSTAEQHMYGDFLDHDQSYTRAEEFLAVCNSFWRGTGEVDFEGQHYRVERGQIHTPFQAPDRTAPEIYVSGPSEQAQRLACSQGTCWLRAADTPENLRPVVQRMREKGIDVCLRLGVVCRETREEAVRAARSLLPQDDAGKRQTPIISEDDSQMQGEATQIVYDAEWLNDILWVGLVPCYGPLWTALVGTPEEIAQAFLEYKKIGVNQFIISGCPELDELTGFGRKILPLVRNVESRDEKTACLGGVRPRA
jgi:alkanesulfonate monooxygenase